MMHQKTMDKELRNTVREFLRLTGRSLRDLTTASRGRYYEVCRTVYGTAPIPLFPFLRIVKGLLLAIRHPRGSADGGGKKKA